MKLATCLIGDRATPVFVIEDRIVTFDEAWRAAGAGPAPDTMLALLEAGDDDTCSRAWAAAQALAGTPVEAATWLPPVKGYKIIGTAINNAALAGLASVVPEQPNFFLKPPSAMIGSGAPIRIRPDYGLTHPEAELAVIIGRRAKALTQANALEAVFGYTIVNDLTSVTLKSEDTFVFPAPDVSPPPPGFEHGDMQLTYHARSKGTDDFAPIGPWLVTKDEIADPAALSVRVFMGDEEVTTDRIANLRYSVADVLVWASRYFTLEPGDILLMGTAAAGRYAVRELDLQRWDGPVTIEINGIGRLSSPVERIDLAGQKVPAATAPASDWPPRSNAA